MNIIKCKNTNKNLYGKKIINYKIKKHKRRFI